MLRSDFYYDLPLSRIARHPAAARTESRLLVLDGATGACRDLQFTDLPAVLRPDDLLVVNDTRVLPARLLGAKDTGGRVELLVERLLDDRRARVQLRASKSPAPGSRLHFDHGIAVTVRSKGDDGFYEVELAGEGTLPEILERIGHMPLPPYIDRTEAASGPSPARGPRLDPIGDEAYHRERYQTVYAREPGAVAAPTAGLHFDAALLDRLRAQGIEIAAITLHVAAGTFQPVRVDDLADHRMHRERVIVPASSAESVNRARAAGRRVVAVGTTVVRALESAVRDGRVEARDGETDIFIYPGYRFQVVDALLTNFHLPESTLLMLVCAFAGTESVLAAYRHAVEQGYRFFSYGDAMFLTAPGRPSGKA